VVSVKVMKNWDPLVFGPLFAIESKPALLWLTLKFSSGKSLP